MTIPATMGVGRPINPVPVNPQPVTFSCALGARTVTGREEVFARLQYAATKRMPHLRELPAHEGSCHVVGSAPSVVNYLKEIRAAGENDLICSVNGAHNWLLNQAITPNIHVLFEYDLQDTFQSLGSEPNDFTTYYVCSHCDQRVFDLLDDFKTALWHSFNDPEEYHAELARLFPGEIMIGCGHATMFRTIAVGAILGYRKFELYGCDSSVDGPRYIEGYGTGNTEEEIDIWGTDPRTGAIKHFRTFGSLAFQADQFIKFCELYDGTLRIRVHGDSLLRYVHEARFPDSYSQP